MWQQRQTSQRQLCQALADISVLMSQASVAYETNDAQAGAGFGRPGRTAGEIRQAIRAYGR